MTIAAFAMLAALLLIGLVDANWTDLGPCGCCGDNPYYYYYTRRFIPTCAGSACPDFVPPETLFSIAHLEPSGIDLRQTLTWDYDNGYWFGESFASDTGEAYGLRYYIYPNFPAFGDCPFTCYVLLVQPFFDSAPSGPCLSPYSDNFTAGLSICPSGPDPFSVSFPNQVCNPSIPHSPSGIIFLFSDCNHRINGFTASSDPV